MQLEPTNLFNLAVCVLFVAVFGEASLSKFAARETPEWFRDKFRNTLLGKLPLAPQWWGIAFVELAILILFLVALGTMEFMFPGEKLWMNYGLLLASGLFSALCFGMRISQDYAGAANSFYYSALTLVLWYAVHTISRGA